jgi:predicted nucleic acid-binding protein
VIVADTNLIAYAVMQNQHTEAAQRVLMKDHEWVSPPILRHEFMNLLATAVRQNIISEATARTAFSEAEKAVRSEEHGQAWDAIKLSIQSRIATYDCEFVVLAQKLSVPLVTADRAVLKAFPETAISIEAFASGS